MRNLVRIEKIDAISPIENADNIEVVTIGGWKVVVKKGIFSKDQKVVFFEIDSWVPEKVAPFLSKGKVPKSYNGIPGNRLRTVKMRGQISQGLVLSFDDCVNVLSDDYFDVLTNVDVGTCVTELFNVTKWEPPIDVSMKNTIEGSFPYFIPKTDQERFQNILPEIEARRASTKFEVTFKLDGTSCTVYRKDKKVGICSRNYELKTDEESIYTIATKEWVKFLDSCGVENIACQGEIVGPGIQKNRMGLKKLLFAVFDIWDIDNQRYFTPDERVLFDAENAFHVPFYTDKLITIDELIGPTTNLADGLLDLADTSFYGKSIEGLVFKSECGTFSFKVINNKYLLENQE